MTEENKPKTSLFTKIFPVVTAVGFGAVFIPYLLKEDNRPVVNLEGTVVEERYVPANALQKTSTMYFFSMDTIEGRVSVEVYNSSNPDIKKEYIDTLISAGTEVKLKAREVSSNKYMTYANNIEVPK